ncbi:hypothetical protein GCM10027049_02950 [Mucilaginibacter puniceus]
MKKLFVFVPAILLGLFLLNSFVLKENKTAKKVNKASKTVVLRSTDGGQTWQDISKGLPERLQGTGVWGRVLANDHGLYINAGNGLYHTNPNAKTSFWTKEAFAGNQRQIAFGNNGIFAYNFRGQFLKKINGTNNWSPMYTDFQEQALRIDKTTDYTYEKFGVKEVRTIFETAAGTVFIGSNNVFFRSADKGKTWKAVQVGDGAMKLAESNGVLLSTSKKGILRSTDDGQTWDDVLSEWGTGIAVERINGGFAAIINNTITKTNSVHISLDSGKTWNVIGEELRPSWISSLIRPQPSSDIYSIKQAGKYLISGHSDGIFRSADMGKTWEKLVLPKENFGFNLSVSGNVIYAIPGKGC